MTSSASVRLYLLSVLCVVALAVDHRLQGEVLRDKTLVVWVKPTDLRQRGGSCLTLDDGLGHFDAVVFGEKSIQRWMPGSDGYVRTQRDVSGYASENRSEWVRMAIVYTDQEIRMYRNDSLYAQYANPAVWHLPGDSLTVFGVRHLWVGVDGHFQGEIDDARIYNSALPLEAIQRLRPNQASEITPWAWWDFEKSPRELTGRYSTEVLLEGAMVREGKLVLRDRGTMIASQSSEQLGKVMLSTSFLRRSESMEPSELSVYRKYRRSLRDDRQRPRWHFVSPEEGHAMPFDPNGAIYWEGRYHLFYIFQENGEHYWGHSSSVDLLHWRSHPTALAVAPGDPDRGIFSGNAFVDRDGIPTIMYHGVGVGNCIAKSTDPLLEQWTKYDQNPIVPIPKEGTPEHSLYASWDPHGWIEDGQCYAIFGGAKPALMRGKSWDTLVYQHPFLENDKLTGPEDDVSCPDFFPIGGSHALLAISHRAGVRWWTGEWKNDHFVVEQQDRITWPGGSYFAPESLVDSSGRRLLWGWVLSQHGHPEREKWTGVMSMPTVLQLTNDKRLRIEPPRELEKLRFHPSSRNNLLLDPGKPLLSEGEESMELDLRFEWKNSKTIHVDVRCSPNQEERTRITLDREGGTIRIDSSKSSLDRDVHYRNWVIVPPKDKMERDTSVPVQSAPLRISGANETRLRVFLDHSLIEVFVDDERYMVQRVYPTRSDSTSISISTEGGDGILRSWEQWELSPTNPY